MGQTLVRALGAALALASAASSASAQLRWPAIHLVAGAGSLHGASIGPRQISGLDTSFVHHDDAPAFTLGLETGTPLRGLDLRLGVQYAAPRVSATPSTGMVAYSLGRDRVTTFTADAVLRLPRVLDAHPYLIGGAGVRRYDFNSRVQDAGAGGKDQTAPIVRVGTGVAWTVGRYDLFAEGMAVRSYVASDPRVRSPFFQAENNFSFTAGLRIPLHR